jgi:branched-chain amino acid aminotransferase
MQHSCAAVSIPPIPQPLFTRAVSLAVALNAEFVPPAGAPAALYIRPLAFGSGAQLNIVPPSEFAFCVFVQPTAALLGRSRAVSALVLEEFDRAAPNGTGSAKVGGNYAPVMRWAAMAKGEGFGITLHLDSRTQSEVEEFSAAGFVGVRRGKDGKKTTLVVPDSRSIIKSVTSDSCLELAGGLGWDVEVRRVRSFS